jgi:hypothetical protein
MQKTHYFCDVCKKEFLSHEIKRFEYPVLVHVPQGITIKNNKPNIHLATIDFCEECLDRVTGLETEIVDGTIQDGLRIRRRENREVKRVPQIGRKGKAKK